MPAEAPANRKAKRRLAAGNRGGDKVHVVSEGDQILNLRDQSTYLGDEDHQEDLLCWAQKMQPKDIIMAHLEAPPTMEAIFLKAQKAGIAVKDLDKLDDLDTDEFVSKKN